MRDDDISKHFPGLANDPGFDLSSAIDFNYNCIAHALGTTQIWFDRGKGCFWPDDIPEDTLEGWIRLFQLHGFEKTNSRDFEAGVERVAIFVSDSEPSHVARQTQNGTWTSKLGWGRDIGHAELKSLEGDLYGQVAQVLQRRRADW